MRWRSMATLGCATEKILTCALIAIQPIVQAAAPASSGLEPPKGFSVRWVSDPADTNKVVVQVAGLSAAALQRLKQSDWTPAQWQRLLSVYAEQGDLAADIGLPAMLGAYRVHLGTLRFEPQFPLDADVKYRAVFRPDLLPDEPASGGKSVSAAFQLPPRPLNPTTVVSRVYPSAGVLPENLLKFYLHFSAPMSRGRIYDHIHLRDDMGKEIELPFLEIDEELWDPGMTRLTLFFDPGRIKRGVLPLEQVGPALESGKRYTLEIDRAWKDGDGSPLREKFQKSFRVGPGDRIPPDPAVWKIQSPTCETRAPLSIAFPEPMDHALAHRFIKVASEAGEVLEGEIELEDQERRWTFAPGKPWRRGFYKLVIATTIEDLAGNNIGKPFEVDLFDNVQPHLNHSSVILSFEVR